MVQSPSCPERPLPPAPEAKPPFLKIPLKVAARPYPMTHAFSSSVLSHSQIGPAPSSVPLFSRPDFRGHLPQVWADIKDTAAAREPEAGCSLCAPQGG